MQAAGLVMVQPAQSLWQCLSSSPLSPRGGVSNADGWHVASAACLAHVALFHVDSFELPENSNADDWPHDSAACSLRISLSDLACYEYPGNAARRRLAL